MWHTLSAGTIKPDTRIIRKYYMFSSSIPLLVIAFALVDEVWTCGKSSENRVFSFIRSLLVVVFSKSGAHLFS